MFNTPVLTVCLLTYNRFDYAVKTLTDCFENLVFPDTWKVRLHIADDGSPQPYVSDLVEEAIKLQKRGLIDGKISVTNAERGGYGKNYNLAMQVIHPNSDLVLPLEDDWSLHQELYLEDLVRVFNDYPDVGCIRLGYLSYTQELRGTVIASNNSKYLLLDPDSDEPHVFAGHPRLETVEWERLVGPWPEGLTPGDTEFRVSTLMARKGIVWPMDLTRSCGDLFQHVGTVRSY